jgi:8-oxo-dGTP diphosphatase
MTTTIDTIAWIHLEDGKILSTRSRGKDVYYIPGGKREPGETDVDTLTREIDEELAVAIIPATARHLGTFQAQAHGHADGIIVRMTCYTAEHHGTPAPAAKSKKSSGSPIATVTAWLPSTRSSSTTCTEPADSTDPPSAFHHGHAAAAEPSFDERYFWEW